MQDKRNRFEKKLSALKHFYLWYYASHKYDLILVSEYPKSGGTWYCQMLAQCLQLPYPRNRMPKLEKSVLHGHLYYSPKFNKPVCMLRDGRDALVSYYHHMYFGNSILPQRVFENYRNQAPFKNFEDTKGNLPAYIEYMFTQYKTSKRFFTWSGFVNSYYGKPGVVFVKYEDLLQDATGTLARSIAELNLQVPSIDIIQKAVSAFSFENVTKRKPGEENKKDFLRKGVAGDWKNHFSKEACEVFNHYAGNELVMLGYEKDKNWY